MDEGAIERARERVAQATEGRAGPADVEAALERARDQIESLARTAADLEASLPERVGDAVREGLRAEALPIGRQVAEVRGLAAQIIRRLERLEGAQLAERYARVDDLGLLVDLVTAGWRGVDERLGRIERAIEAVGGATVYRIEERRTS